MEERDLKPDIPNPYPISDAALEDRELYPWLHKQRAWEIYVESIKEAVGHVHQETTL